MANKKPELKRYSVSLLFRRGSTHALAGYITSAFTKQKALENAIAGNATLFAEGYQLSLNVILEIHDSLFSVPPNEPDRS